MLDCTLKSITKVKLDLLSDLWFGQKCDVEHGRAAVEFRIPKIPPVDFSDQTNL